MRHRHFHPDEDFIESDGLDPSLESHSCQALSDQLSAVNFTKIHIQS
jgi:hypothetical protein